MVLNQQDNVESSKERWRLEMGMPFSVKASAQREPAGRCFVSEERLVKSELR